MGEAMSDVAMLTASLLHTLSDSLISARFGLQSRDWHRTPVN